MPGAGGDSRHLRGPGKDWRLPDHQSLLRLVLSNVVFEQLVEHFEDKNQVKKIEVIIKPFQTR